MADTKPTVTIPEGAPPTDLVIEDIEVGDGTEAVAGANVTVHYVGVAWSDQQQFDASWDRDDLFEFPLGRGYVIAGWDQGVQGMRVGGRRRITIPPHLGYGARGFPPVIPPNSTLVFEVELLSIR